jgi:hypothetical protein
MFTTKSLSLLTLIFRSINLNEKVLKTSIIVLVHDQNGSIQRMIASGRDLGMPSTKAAVGHRRSKLLRTRRSG